MKNERPRIYIVPKKYLILKKMKYMGLGECIAMLIGFRPSQAAGRGT